MTPNVRRGAVLIGAALSANVLLTSCGSGEPGAADDEVTTSDVAGGVTAEAVPSSFPTRASAGEEPGCGDDAPQHAVCWFIKSVRAGDESGFKRD